MNLRPCKPKNYKIHALAQTNKFQIVFLELDDSWDHLKSLTGEQPHFAVVIKKPNNRTFPVYLYDYKVAKDYYMAELNTLHRE